MMSVDIIMISGAIFAFIMALGQLLIKNQRPANQWLIFLLFTCFAWITHAVWFRLGLIQQYPHLNKLHVPFLSVTGPLWYNYIYCLHETDIEPNSRYRIIFPIAVVFCLSLPFYFESETFKREYVETNIDGASALMMYIATRFAEIAVIVYCVKAVLYVKRVRTTSAIELASSMRLIGSIFQIHEVSVAVPTIIIACLLISLYLLSYRKPVVLGLDRSESRIRKITTKDVMVLDDFRHQIMVEQWYLDPNLKLQKLARKLEIPPKNLSELINQAEGVNFNEFVNRLRIEHAQSIMATNPVLSNDEVADSSGFNSRSVFYTKFKYFTGVTPTEFKKNTEHIEVTGSKI